MHLDGNLALCWTCVGTLYVTSPHGGNLSPIDWPFLPVGSLFLPCLLSSCIDGSSSLEILSKMPAPVISLSCNNSHLRQIAMCAVVMTGHYVYQPCSFFNIIFRVSRMIADETFSLVSGGEWNLWNWLRNLALSSEILQPKTENFGPDYGKAECMKVNKFLKINLEEKQICWIKGISFYFRYHFVFVHEFVIFSLLASFVIVIINVNHTVFCVFVCMPVWFV